MTERAVDYRAIGMGLAFAFMWSSAFTSARIIVASAPPLASLSLRFLLSGLLALMIARALGENFNLTRGQWRATFIFGLCQNALYLGLNFVAMQTVEASLASIIASTMPLLVALIGWIVLGQRLRPMGVMGLILGMIGVTIIMGSRLSGGTDPIGIALCVMGAISLAVATLTVRGASSGGNLLTIVGLQMLVGSAILAIVALFLEEMIVSPNWPLVLAFAYTTLVPGLAATWVWFVLVGRIGAVRASTFHFLNPFFGVLVAAVLLGEAVGLFDIVGVVVIAVGILAVQLSRQPHADVKPDPSKAR